MLGAGVWNGPTSFFTAVHLPVPMRTHPSITQNSGGYGNINIESTDTYGITNVTQPSSGHAHSNSNQAQQYSGYSSFVITWDTSYSVTTGYGGLVLCDQANDFFILNAEL